MTTMSEMDLKCGRKLCKTLIRKVHLEENSKESENKYLLVNFLDVFLFCSSVLIKSKGVKPCRRENLLLYNHLEKLCLFSVLLLASTAGSCRLQLCKEA